MIDYNLIQGKSISLVILNSEKEDDVRVYVGVIIKKGDGFHFINQSKKWHFTLTPDLLTL